MNKLAIIGAGSWGTALALTLSPRFGEIALWARDPSFAEELLETRINRRYLPGIRLPDNVQPTAGLDYALRGAAIVLSAVPSRFMRALYESMHPHVTPGMCFVSATKGIENVTLMRMSELIEQVLSPRLMPRVAVLSGPTFAKEIAEGEPAAVVIAAREAALAGRIQAAFSGPSLRLYTSCDVIGVETGAALKNVIAIGAGICRGLGLGGNSVAALITRGLAELTRLAVALGGEARTLSGLAGLGDLVLTATGDLSRNRFVGLQLAAGKPLSEIVAGMTQVAEGVDTCRAARELSRTARVHMPISEAMYEILYRGKPVAVAIRELMERPLTSE
ncbi:MAG: NAD(P)H-dependent glycerol-3-phosphate dehydrogenase [Bryobacteraceae bacterium]